MMVHNNSTFHHSRKSSCTQCPRILIKPLKQNKNSPSGLPHLKKKKRVLSRKEICVQIDQHKSSLGLSTFVSEAAHCDRENGRKLMICKVGEAASKDLSMARNEIALNFLSQWRELHLDSSEESILLDTKRHAHPSGDARSLSCCTQQGYLPFDFPQQPTVL